MHLAANNKAEMDFEELLSAVWAAQLAQLRAHPDSGELQADPDSQKTTGKEGDVR
jgi:hypothetical protein